MKIPIRNLFYLLCYAWDILDRGDELDLGESAAPDVENLAAEVLADGIERLLRRGLERNYKEAREDSKILRGRIDFQQTVKRFLVRRREAHIVMEDLSSDTLTNQILKASCVALLRFSTLTPESREGMAGLYHALRGVSDIQLSASTFYRVRLHTNNRDYRVLLGICEMVFRYTSPDEMGEGVRFIDFLRDEVKMRRVFQAFITNFYRRRQQEYTVNAEAFQWYASMAHHSLEVGLPRLHTDVVLSNPTKKIVIDTKYTPQHFDKRFGKTMLRPSHVNQIFAYMQNVEARDHGNRPVEGILLYPATSNLFCLKWTLFGHALISATVNLSRTWREIEKELLLLIGIVEKNAAATV